MTLDWRTTSDGERWYANVEGGQLIVTRSLIFGWWTFEWFVLDDYELRRDGRMKFWNREFGTADKAKAAVETWYTSTRSSG